MCVSVRRTDGCVDSSVYIFERVSVVRRGKACKMCLCSLESKFGCMSRNAGSGNVT